MLTSCGMFGEIDTVLLFYAYWLHIFAKILNWILVLLHTLDVQILRHSSSLLHPRQNISCQSGSVSTCNSNSHCFTIPTYKTFCSCYLITFPGSTMKVASLAVFLCVFVSIRSHNIVKRQEGGGGARSRKIADGVYAFTSNGQYVSMFIVDPEGVMVIEPVNVQHSQQMLEEVQKITQAPIKYLFYSHNHYDHAKGGQVWKDQGATIVSHVDAFDYIKAYPSKDLILPDMKWTGDFFTMTVGNQKLELHHYGLSHGSGMTAFILPKQRVSKSSIASY